MVEHSAVNRVVVGSSPTRGVKVNSFIIKPVDEMFTGFLSELKRNGWNTAVNKPIVTIDITTKTG